MEASKLIGYDGYFAKRLRELMKNAKVTQQDLAASVGTTRQAISQYADGSVQPNIEKLYKIAEFFNVSADYLLGLSSVASSDVDVKAINKMLGLSEKAIKNLKDDIDMVRSFANKGIIDISDIENTEELLKEYAHMRMLDVSVINLLLEEPYRGEEEVISLLGDVLTYEYNEEPDASFAISKITVEQDENGDENWNAEVCDSTTILKKSDIFAIKLLKLQQAISLYKKELDAHKANGDK